MKKTLLAAILTIATVFAAATAYSQGEPFQLFRSLEVHRGRVLLGKNINLVYDGATVDANKTTVSVVDPTGARTVTLPDATGPLATVYSCGASLAANGTCANTATGTFHMITGSAVLGSNTSTITGISPTFSSATSWWCAANDITTRANPVQAVPASSSTLTITNTTGASDLVQYVCLGN